MKRLYHFSLKNKIQFSFLGVVLAVSLSIAFLARGILVTSLTDELELRGRAIAHSIAEHGTSYLLDKDYPKLLNLIVEEAYLGEREQLVSYIFITDPYNAVVSNTFFRPFPASLRAAAILEREEEESLIEVRVYGEMAYDIASPIKEGLYRIGTVHVGLSKTHMDNLVNKLRNTFLGFLSLIIVIILVISHYFSRSVIKPLTVLTTISDEMSRGNFDAMLEVDGENRWDPSKCSAYMNTDLPCWHFDQSAGQAAGEPPHKCKTCEFYKKREGDEVVQLEDSFRNMLWSIKLYRRRLRESEEKYRSLFDSGPDPIFVVATRRLEIIDLNPRATDMYGYEKDELIGQSFLMLGPDHEKNYSLVHEPEDSATGCIYYPKVIHYKKGERPFFVNIHACPITYQGREAMILATMDITEMIEKDAQLIQAAKMKSLGEMSAGVAHEINQPLNNIQLGCEVLALYREQQRPIPEEKLDKVIHSVFEQVDRAKDIIETLRAFGRKADIFKETLSINTPIRKVLSIVRKQFELDNISITLELDDDLPMILAHDNKLQQVFFNVLNNARDALNEICPEQGEAAGGPQREIRVRTLRQNGHVLVEIADTGNGIPEFVRSKIFEPFFTTKTVGKGTGLGLAITYGIVKDYGGDITICDEEGMGAVFQLTFPVIPQ